jgi:hypothetical protein
MGLARSCRRDRSVRHDQVRAILSRERIREIIETAFRKVVRAAAVRDLVALGNEGAFEALLESDAEVTTMGSCR